MKGLGASWEISKISICFHWKTGNDSHGPWSYPSTKTTRFTFTFLNPNGLAGFRTLSNLSGWRALVELMLCNKAFGVWNNRCTSWKRSSEYMKPLLFRVGWNIDIDAYGQEHTKCIQKHRQNHSPANATPPSQISDTVIQEKLVSWSMKHPKNQALRPPMCFSSFWHFFRTLPNHTHTHFPLDSTGVNRAKHPKTRPDRSWSRQGSAICRSRSTPDQNLIRFPPGFFCYTGW